MNKIGKRNNKSIYIIGIQWMIISSETLQRDERMI